MARLVLLILLGLLLDTAPAAGQAFCAPVRLAPVGAVPEAGSSPAAAVLYGGGARHAPAVARLVHPPDGFLRGQTRTVFTACDGWTGQDKYKHAAFSFTLTASMYYLIKNGTNLSRTGALLVSIGTMTAIGLTKEWVDWQNQTKRCFSAGDMLANGAGMAAAAGFVLLF